MKLIDWKTFFASSMFFFIYLINPRDFPVNNVPLIYPAFLLFAVLIGPNFIIEGFRRTKFLSILLIIFWFYYRMLVLLKGGAIKLEDFAYLLEPLLVFGVAGATGIRRGGTKAALWALVFTITLSTAFGIWIFFIGEPVSSWRSIIHTSIGGDLLQGEILRDKDQRIDQALVYVRNTGLSYAVFTFSYQLAVALSMTLAGFFCKKGFKINLVLLGTFLILIVGIITNTERASLVSVSVGLLSFLLIRKEKIISRKRISSFIIIIFVILYMVVYDFSAWERDTLFDRHYSKKNMTIRAYIVIPAIVATLYEPWGSGSSSDYYDKVAKRVGWVDNYGRAVSAHNHFVNIILATGIVGIYLIILLFRELWVKIKYVRRWSPVLGDDRLILVIGCITCIIHSLTHNAGFFRGGYTTHIVFGLLWSATPKIKYIISNHNIINKAFYSKFLTN